MNFFSDSISKGIGHRRNDKSIFNKSSNDVKEEKKDDDEDKKTVSDFDNNDDEDRINILTKDQFHEMKKKTDKNQNNERNENNILEESDELKDSYCDNILENIKKFRGEMQNDE